MRRIATSLLLLALPVAAPAQNGDAGRARMARAIKIVPVPHLIRALPAPPPLPFGTLIGCAPGFDSMRTRLLLGLREGNDETGQISDLAQVVRDLTPLSWDDSSCRADLVGDAMILSGSPDQIHLIEQTLQKLTACVGEPFRVRAAAFHVEQSAELTVTGTYAALRGKLAQLGAEFVWEGTTTAAAGQVVELGPRSANQYIMDLEVEIAQASSASNPVPASMQLGATLQVEAHPLTGSSDAVVFAQFARGEAAAPLRHVPLGKDDAMPRMEAPTLAITFGCFSGRVANGGALLALMEGTWAGRRFGLLVGTERTPVPPEVERDLGVFPLGAFLGRALRHPLGVMETGDAGAERWSPPLGVHENPRSIEPADNQTLESLLAHAIGDDQTNLTMADGRVTVRGSADSKQTVARFLEQLQDQFFKTVEVECRLDGQLGGQAMVAQRILFPALLGRHHVVVHGVETTSVYDAEVEVAQKAGVSDPKVVRQFSGTECCVRPYALAAGLAVTADIHVVDTTPTRVYVPENELGVPIDEPTITATRHRHHGRVAADGSPIDFGQGPTLTVDQRSVVTRQTLAVRAR